MSNPYNSEKDKLIKTLGQIIKQKRLEQNKTIYKISAESSMSKSTWREAELGVCKDINLSTIWKISYGLDMEPYKLIFELTEKLGKNFSLTEYD